jgi:hypothetical protein
MRGPKLLFHLDSGGRKEHQICHKSSANPRLKQSLFLKETLVNLMGLGRKYHSFGYQVKAI